VSCFKTNGDAWRSFVIESTVHLHNVLTFAFRRHCIATVEIVNVAASRVCNMTTSRRYASAVSSISRIDAVYCRCNLVMSCSDTMYSEPTGSAAHVHHLIRPSSSGMRINGNDHSTSASDVIGLAAIVTVAFASTVDNSSTHAWILDAFLTEPLSWRRRRNKVGWLGPWWSEVQKTVCWRCDVLTTDQYSPVDRRSVLHQLWLRWSSGRGPTSRLNGRVGPAAGSDATLTTMSNQCSLARK